MRGLLKSVIGLAVIGGLLVGADRVAVGVAEDQAADKLVSSGKLSGSKPQVTIEGFPFLTQAVAGDFSDIKLKAGEVTVNGGREQVTLRSFDAELTGVQVGDNYRSATVKHGTGNAVIGYQDMARLIPDVPGLGFEYGGPGKVKLTLAGQTVATGNLHSSGKSVVADNIQLQGLAKMFGSAVPKNLLAPHSFALDGLPAGLSLAGATPQQDGLRLDFQGSDLKLMG